MEGRYCLQKSCRKSWSPPLGSTYTSSSRPRLLLLKNLSVEEAAHRQLKGRPLELLEGSGTIYKSDAEPEMVRHVKSHQRALVSRFLGQ